MSRRICLLAALTLCLCTLAVAAPNEPAQNAASAPAPPAASNPQAVAPPAAPVPAWLRPPQPAENQSKLMPNGKDPSTPVFLSYCSNQCWAAYWQCNAGCTPGDSSCFEGCANDRDCCLWACNGYYCP